MQEEIMHQCLLPHVDDRRIEIEICFNNELLDLGADYVEDTVLSFHAPATVRLSLSPDPQPWMAYVTNRRRVDHPWMRPFAISIESRRHDA